MQLNFIKRYILLVGIAWTVICAAVTVSFLLLSGLWLENLAAVMLFMLLWLAGLTAVVLLGRKLYLQTSAVFESERQRDQAEMSLNKFPVDRLKIDRSFIMNITDNEEDRILVSLVTELGRKLGLNVIAEGVEDDFQKNLLIGMGCHAMQGYLFGRPVPFDEFCNMYKSMPAV